MIKLICLDIDGTLLDSNHKVTEKNMDSLKRAIDKGVLITIASGRMFPSAKFFGKVIGINAPLITMNGAYVKDDVNDKVVADFPMKKEDVIKLYAILKEFDIKPNLYTVDTMFVSERADRYNEMNKLIPVEERYKIVSLNEEYGYEELFRDHGHELYKCIIFPKISDKPSIKKRVLEELNLSIVESHETNYEFTSVDATKGNAVLKLAEYYGFKNEEVMTVGDSENDLSMIEAVENSVAMGNASDLIKKKAKYMTKTNDESGVSYIIEKVVMKNEF